jgi:NTE family protein
MPKLPKASKLSKPSALRPKVALALAGGGFLGAAYELGVLAAISESIEGLDLHDLSSYVGVSAGAYVAAGLANGMTPHQMIRIFVEAEDSETPLGPEVLLRPDYRQLFGSLRAFPKTFGAVSRHFRPKKFSMLGALEEFGRSLPSGFFSAAPIAKRMRELLTQPGYSDNFKTFKGRLRILATDIDSGQSVEFGSQGFEATPISKALSASSALPGLFVPVEIDGRRYLDGAINKTLHASVALNQGADLVICINPLVPYFATLNAQAQQLSSTNLPTILAQTVRTVIRSRMTVGLEKYSVAYPNAAVLLFEPKQGDAAIFMTSILSLKNRRKICELAYQQTRNDLRLRQIELKPILEKVGLSLRIKAIAATATPLVGVQPRLKPRKPNSMDGATIRLRHALEDLDRKVLMGKLA